MARKRRNTFDGEEAYKESKTNTVKRPAFLSRCSPSMLKSTVETLGKKQKSEITKMGFGNLLHVDCIPCEGTLFNLEDEIDYSNDVNLFRGKKSADLRAMLGMKSGSSHFRRAFILFVLATFLCPTSKDTPSSKLLPTIIDVKNPTKFNWGQLVLDWLVEEIIVFKKDWSKRSIGGCMYFLQAPLIKHWRNENIQQRIPFERKNDHGLIAIAKSEIDPVWVKNVFKHEVHF
ncbi:hypothetical protein SESBI_37901 [Sesbania bispinosa]|nr:hypothetical protein SESBI_37901 [Sesbania bispinosa]